MNDLKSSKSTGIFLNVGLSYDFPHFLGNYGVLSPQFILNYGYIDLGDNFTVDINSIQLGLSYRF